jgi:large subunit ribosomal protein L18
VGTEERPRLVVYRSLKNMEAQLVDDTKRVTLLGISTRSSDVRDAAGEKSKTDVGRLAGKLLAERALEKGIKRVVFDRAGYLYHGRVKGFAEGAREGGLEF